MTTATCIKMLENELKKARLYGENMEKAFDRTLQNYQYECDQNTTHKEYASDLEDKVENQKEKILILQAQVYILKDAMRVMVTGGD